MPCSPRRPTWASAVGGPVPVGARSGSTPRVLTPTGVGEDCVLHSGVHVREACRLGDRVIVQNGAVIGGDGFGFARGPEGRYEKIPQVGIVVVEDDVEIGSNVAIDRAALKETRIGRGTKIDNLVQIGHSVVTAATPSSRARGHRGQHPRGRGGHAGRTGRRGRPHHDRDD